MKKFLKWLGIAILVLVVLPAGLVISWNALDEKPDPKALDYGKPIPTSTPEAANGYFAALGMGAPEGADIVGHGKALLDEEKAAARENRVANHPKQNVRKRPRLCNPMERSCIAALRDNETEIVAQQVAYKEDLIRYEKLLSHTGFEEIVDYPQRMESLFPLYTGVRDVRLAYLMQIARSIKAGKVEEALGMLERQFTFSRLMLSGSRSGLGIAYARSYYMQDLVFMADVLQQNAGELKPFAVRVAAMIPKLDLSIIRYGDWLRIEYQMITRSMRDLSRARTYFGEEAGGFEHPLATLLYRRNATANALYTHLSSFEQISTGTLTQINVELERQQKSIYLADEGFFQQWDNPFGKILLKMAMPGLRHSMDQLYDLDVLSRLVMLRAAMLAAGVDAKGAPEFLAKSSVALHDPRTGKPMAWDGESMRIYGSISAVAAKRKTSFSNKNSMFVQL